MRAMVPATRKKPQTVTTMMMVVVVSLIFAWSKLETRRKNPKVLIR